MKKELKFLKANPKSTLTFLVFISVIAFFITSIIIFYNYFDAVYDEIISTSGNQVTVTSSTSNVNFSDLYELLVSDNQELYKNTHPVNIQNMSINIINDNENITSTLINVDIDLNHYFELNNIDVNEQFEILDNYEVVISSTIAEEYKIKKGDELSFTTQSSLTNSWEIPTLEVVGIFNSPSRDNYLYTNENTIESIAGITGETINRSFTVFTDSKDDTRDILLYLEKNHNKASFTYDFSLNNQLYDIALVPLYNQLTNFIYLLLFSSIFIILVYVVLYGKMMKKRRSEIRIYYYLGMRYYAVAKVFIKESLLIIFTSLMIGFLASLAYSILFRFRLLNMISAFNLDLGFINNKAVILSSALVISLSFVIIAILLLIVHIIIYNYNLKKVKFDV